MNVTELARRLKIPTNELRELLPLLGFDIGKKAIKVDDKAAQKIIEKVREDPTVVDRVRATDEPEEEIAAEEISEIIPEITIPTSITVRDLAELLKKPVATVIQELMKNGILANLNEQIDYETASIIAQDFNFKTAPAKDHDDTEDIAKQASIEEILNKDGNATTPRPPVVVVMGHVDHGKTQLLDTIRTAKVVESESGGITQHIGAYQVEKNGKLITLIDTPGHEAFTAMRSRGARVADIAILIIAADDGIKPQTEEALQIIQSAKLPFIVAINKIDKPEADIEKVKQQLAQRNLLPEDWGGTITCVPVSAKKGDGIDNLLEHLILLAEVEQENIKANPDAAAVATVIESHVDRGEGPVATAIVQTGTLRRGEAIQVGQSFGKIRTMKSYRGEDLKEATPSTPVKILGLKAAPEVGDFLQVVEDTKELKQKVRDLQRQRKMHRDRKAIQKSKSKDEDKDKEKQSVDIILKTDTIGSQEAIAQSLEIISSDDVKIQIVKKGLGNITDADVLQADATGATLYGFNVNVNTGANEIAKEKELPVETFEVIYDLIDAVKKEKVKYKKVEVERVDLGRIKVLAIFKTDKKSMIIGGLVTKGKVEVDATATIIRDEKPQAEGIINKLQQAKQDVKSIAAGTECGIEFTGAPIIKVGDFLEVYKEEIKG